MQTVAIGSIWARRGPTLIKNIRERSRRSLVNIPKDHFASYLKLIAIVKARRVNKTASNFGQEPARRFYVKEAYFRLHLANKCTELVLSLMHPQSAFTFPAFVFFAQRILITFAVPRPGTGICREEIRVLKRKPGPRRIFGRCSFFEIAVIRREFRSLL